jgi:hypothetical protein
VVAVLPASARGLDTHCDAITRRFGRGAGSGGAPSARASLSVSVVYAPTAGTRLLFAAVARRGQVGESGTDLPTATGVMASADAADAADAAPSSFLELQQEQQHEQERHADSTQGLDEVDIESHYTEDECKFALNSYRALILNHGGKQKTKIFALDELLGRVLHGDSPPVRPAEVHEKAALSLLLGRMQLCHKVEGLAAKKGVGQRTSIRNGMPPPLQVKTVSPPTILFSISAHEITRLSRV